MTHFVATSNNMLINIIITNYLPFANLCMFKPVQVCLFAFSNFKSMKILQLENANKNSLKTQRDLQIVQI